MINLELSTQILQENNQLKALLCAQQLQLDVYKTQTENLEKRLEQYTEAYDRLQFQLKQLLRYRYGQKSERFIDEDNPQFNLFDKKFTKDDLPEVEEDFQEEQSTEVKAHSRRKRNKSDNSHLPVQIKIISASEEDMQCSCGARKKVIRYEIKRKLHYIPEQFEIIEERREVVACAHGCEGSIKTAPAPLSILPKVKVTESFLAFLIISKMNDRQPLYHLEDRLKKRHDIDCSRTNMANWLIKLTTPLQPLFNLMKDEVIDYDIAGYDATNLQVLKEPGRPATRKSYVYCTRGGAPGKEVVLYDYNYEEHKKYTKDWFAGFKGYIHMDADPFFEYLVDTAGIQANYCNCHARRKFEPIAKLAKKKGLAKKALAFYKSLYKIEKRAKKEKLTSEERYELRQKESKPIMVEFKQWLDDNQPLTLTQSPLGKAIKYCIKHWPGLIKFLEDGKLEADNNLVEQQIKPFVIARKNFLFADTMAGARALCMHFSIIQTANAHELNPYQYYKHILERIPHCKSVEDYEKLLPWNFAKPPPDIPENIPKN